MPNASITVYLNDGLFVKYLKQKKEINEKVRILVKELLEGER
jgi:hypothetical protein